MDGVERAIARVLALAAVAALLAPRVPAQCSALDDPFQVLDFHLTMDPADWEIVLHTPCCDADTSSPERPAEFRCGDEPPVLARVRLKPTHVLPSSEAPVKPSLKIDFDDRVPDGEWHGRRKVSLENGAGGVLLTEGIAWQLMGMAGHVTSGSSWVRLHVNGTTVGIYTRVEQVDKSFLRRHLDEDEGFLYKWGEQRTREDEVNPRLEELCFSPFGSSCPLPPDGYSSILRLVDMHQLLTLGTVNAFVANRDGPLGAETNYWMYDSERPRLYFPWDLDKSFWLEPDADPHQLGRGISGFEQVLLRPPTLRRSFDRILRRLLAGPFHPAALDAWLDELADAIGPAIDADPLNDLGVSAAEEIARIRSWLQARVAVLEAILPPEPPFPLVITELLAANRSIHPDEEGEFDDWVELCNGGSESLQIEDLYLSDRPAEPARWRLPDGELAPGECLVVWCDGEEEEGPYHAPFRLDAEGESIGLYHVAGGDHRTLDFVRFGRQEEDVTLGRLPGGPPRLTPLECPSPGKPNAACHPEGARFVRGDTTGDGGLELTDAVRTLAGLFRGEPLECARAADADDDGAANLTDAVYVLLHLFRQGPAPPAPFPACGEDPTPDGLDCRRPQACP